MSRRNLALACLLAGLLATAALPGAALAQGSTFCLADGKQIMADRFEQRDGKFYLHLPGSGAPLEYAAADVAGINVPCQPGPVRAALAVSPVAAASPTGGADFAVHGSNTIGERLMPLLIEAYGQRRHGVRPTAKLGQPEEQELTLGAAGGPKTTIELHAHGSGTSAKGLLSGAAQIGMSSRPATDAEVQAIQAAHGVNIRTPGSEHVLALDGLAVIVNPANPVRQLSLDQVAQIFAGQITSWSAVGGPSAPIVVHRRDDKSGTYDTFNSLVLSPRKVKPSPQATAHESSETLSEAVFRDQNAIGFIGLPYINRNKPLPIAESCGITTAASRFTVKSESYPLARRLYLYSFGRPKHRAAQDLLEFVMSDEAQPTIQEAGFVEQSVEIQAAADQQAWADGLASAAGAYLPAGKELPQPARATLARTIAGAQRTSLVLRFERASSALDTRAQQDVARFARYLRSPEARGKRFWIAGFADSDGPWGLNVNLSRDRAASVQQALTQAGVPVQDSQLMAFSYQAPVACNDTNGGRAKNRRVEIWMTR